MPTPRTVFCTGSPASGTRSGTMVEVTTAGTFNATYADCAIQMNFTASLELPFLTDAGAADSVVAAEVLDVRADYVLSGASSSTVSNMLELRDASFPWVALRNVAAFQFGLFVNTGTGAVPVWTQKGANFDGSNSTYVLRVTIGSPHSVILLRNGVVAASGTWVQASLTALTKAKFLGLADQNSAHWSQLAGAVDISLIGAFVPYCKPTGAGASNTFTSGTSADVDDVVRNDADFMVSNVAGQAFTLNVADVVLPAGYIISNANIETIDKSDLTTPQNFATRVLSGGIQTNDTPRAAGAGFAAIQFRCPLDPNTGFAWTQAGWNAAQVGGASS